MEKILITGASSGIGKELAKKLAIKSKKMYLLARSSDKLNLLKKELEEKNPLIECICIEYDLTDIDNLRNIVENCDVDLVINCAGFGKITDFLKLSDKEDLDTVNVNFVSPLILTKKFSEKFLQKGKGIILNVCSTGALYQHPYMAVYSSTKSALLHYSLASDEKRSDCLLVGHIGHPCCGCRLVHSQSYAHEPQPARKGIRRGCFSRPYAVERQSNPTLGKLGR